MISEPTYLAAKMVSTTIKEHFEREKELSLLQNIPFEAAIPDLRIIEAIIDTAFWASLRREEGYAPKISMAFLPPSPAVGNLTFQQWQRFTPQNLVKLSPAVIQPGIHLGIWVEDGNLYIWGTTPEVPTLSFVLEVVEAGLLVIKQKSSDSYGKFTNIAVLKGDQIKIVDETVFGLTNCPDVLSSLLGLSIRTTGDKSINMLVELAIAMRNHGRGALLLIVPPNSSAWLQSIVLPISYRINPAYALVLGEENEDMDAYGKVAYEARVRKAIHVVGGFSAVDGATVITQDHQLLAFGVKVARSDANLPVDQIMVTEPVKDAKVELLDATKIGGTRHLAAAQFVNDQHDCMAMVASQDGLFTVFVWSAALSRVLAHRIDTLLM